MKDSNSKTKLRFDIFIHTFIDDPETENRIFHEPHTIEVHDSAYTSRLHVENLIHNNIPLITRLINLVNATGAFIEIRPTLVIPEPYSKKLFNPVYSYEIIPGRPPVFYSKEETDTKDYPTFPHEVNLYNNCDVCDNNDFTYSQPQIQSNAIVVRKTCNNCGCVYEENYTLKSYKLISVPNTVSEFEKNLDTSIFNNEQIDALGENTAQNIGRIFRNLEEMKKFNK